MNRALSSFLVAAVFVAVPAFSQTFVFDLSGSQEVPPVSTTATGGCMAQLDQPNKTLSITCVHDVLNATIMHIHRGAAGSTGPIAFDLGSPASPVVATWTGMTATDINDALAGNLYVNIHTAGRPNGEIRGQVLPRTVDTVSFTANGAQVVPPNSTSATASCTANLSDDATQLAIQCTHDLSSPNSAHVSEAPAGENGPVVYNLPSPVSPISVNMPMTPRLVADFAATFLYLEIVGPAGSEDTGTPTIRGQIGTPPAPPTTGTIKIVKKTSPAGGTGFGFTDNVPGSGSFIINDGQTQTLANVAPGTYAITENDPSSSNYTLTDLVCGDNDSTTDVFGRTANVHLQAGETVTCTFTNLQTQGPASSLFVFHLSGDQEVPPVTTTQRGGCFAQFNAGTSTLSLVCVHDVLDATVMHIHRGGAGTSGAIAFDLGSPVSPVEATWSGMSPADVADLFAGNLYINIHTGGRPGGAIRGQIVPRSVDTISFTADGAHYVPPNSTTATGQCTANLSDDATQLALNCTHNEPSPASAHVNEAPEGQNGPIAYTFASPASPLSANMPMTPRLVADFAAYFLYLEILGATGVEGAATPAIRGQIGTPFVIPTTGTIVITKKTTPAGGTGFGFTDNVPGSSGSFTLNDAGSKTFLNVPVGTYTITENAASGYSLSNVVCGDNDSVGNPFNRTASVHLQGGETVTCTFTNLQSVTPTSLFVFRLSPDQEVPPVAGAERGGCFGQFNSATSTLSLICTHDVVGPTVMHIHRGAAGTTGPVAFDLGNPQSPMQATWSNMSAADVADLLAGNLYVNIHTSGRPAGALRGQIVPRNVDSFNFAMTGSQEVPPTDSLATGACFADLSDDATSLFVQCAHNAPSPTAAHLHDAPPGIDGPVVFDYPAASAFAGTTPLTPRLVADFAAGFLYVDVHTPNYDTGEIRGQLVQGPVVPVPAFSEWTLIALAITIAAAGFARMR